MQKIKTKNNALLLALLVFGAFANIALATGNNPDLQPQIDFVDPHNPYGELAAGTKSFSLNYTTDENATCRYSDTPDKPYAEMTGRFTITGQLKQSIIFDETHPLPGGVPYSQGGILGTRYDFYIKCQNAHGISMPEDYHLPNYAHPQIIVPSGMPETPEFFPTPGPMGALTGIDVQTSTVGATICTTKDLNGGTPPDPVFPCGRDDWTDSSKGNSVGWQAGSVGPSSLGTTIKAIAVLNGVASPVVTGKYTLFDQRQDNNIVKISNVTPTTISVSATFIGGTDNIDERGFAYTPTSQSMYGDHVFYNQGNYIPGSRQSHYEYYVKETGPFTDSTFSAVLGQGPDGPLSNYPIDSPIPSAGQGANRPLLARTTYAVAPYIHLTNANGYTGYIYGSGLEVATAAKTGSSAKAITSFKMDSFNPSVVGIINEENHTIDITLPYDTKITAANIVATIKNTGRGVKRYGWSVSDYYYVVFAEDGSRQAYTLNVTTATTSADTAKDSLTPAKLIEDTQKGLISFEGQSMTDTPKVTFNGDYVMSSANSLVTIPDKTVMTKNGGGNVDLTAMTSRQLFVPDVAGAIKFGIPNTSVSFSGPVTLSINVGPQNNGKTLNIYSQNDGDSNWKQETSTCTVSNDTCVFSVNHGTVFAANETVPAVGSALAANTAATTAPAITKALDYINPLEFTNVEGLLGGILSAIQKIIVSLALVFIVIGAFLYITAGANPDNAENGKKAIVAALIGLAIGIAAPSLLKEIGNTIGWGDVNSSAVGGALGLSDIAIRVLNFLLGIMGIVALIMLVIGAMIYLTSAGDDDRINKGKEIFKYSLIGILIAMASMVLVRQIAAFFIVKS
jgi:hypothetical protein